MKILIAMSGGVDSSTAAVMLKKQGHEVQGVTLKLWEGGDGEKCAHKEMKDGEGGLGKSSCCGASDAAAAAAVARANRFPHRVFHFEDRFRDTVLKDFVEAYLSGRTPNPCVVCNEKVKFAPLLEMADELGLDAMATGHYARVEKDKDGAFHLLKARDPVKDQSYFLYRLSQDELKRIVFPLGGLAKEEVRGMAREWGLAVADKPDSMDICFAPGGDYAPLLISMAGDKPAGGPIEDTKGHELGRHPGIVYFTIGQRKGLGIPGKEPKYVVRLDAGRNAVVVGGEKDLYAREALLEAVLFTGPVRPIAAFPAVVKIRSTHQGAAAEVEPLGSGRWKASFEQPQRAVTPGQAAVFYSGDECLGGGTII